MPMSSTRDGEAWLIAGSAAALARFEPALEAHRMQREVRLVELPAAGQGEWWRGRLDEVAAAVLVADPHVAPRDAVPATHLPDTHERRVPVGVVPDSVAAASAIAAVQRRVRTRLGPGPVVLLGSREQRARQLAERIEAVLLEGDGPAVRRLTAERLPRYALLGALGLGPGLAVYVGQGHSRGWGGYGGVEAWQFDVAGAQVLGAVLSLTCYAAARPASAPSFSEELVLRGRAASALGAIGAVQHNDNASLALAVARRLTEGATTLADALPVSHRALGQYRIVGDPLAPLIGARGARRGIAAVFAPKLGDELPPVDWRRAPAS